MTTIFSLHGLTSAFLLTVPLIVGGVFHMVIVKWDILSYFKKPIHPRWFGQNKTWRGFIVMPLVTWPGVVLAQSLERVIDLNTPLLSHTSSWLLALGLGLGYCLLELPNSFMKRRLGIKEGQTAEHSKWLFVFIDQGDSALGCMLVYKYLVSITWPLFWATIAFGTGLHLLINLSLYKAKLRKNPF